MFLWKVFVAYSWETIWVAGQQRTRRVSDIQTHLFLYILLKVQLALLEDIYFLHINYYNFPNLTDTFVGFSSKCQTNLSAFCQNCFLIVLQYQLRLYIILTNVVNKEKRQHETLRKLLRISFSLGLILLQLVLMFFAV